MIYNTSNKLMSVEEFICGLAPRKVFVSLPMRGHTDDEVRTRQNQIFELFSSLRTGRCTLTFTVWQEKPPSPSNQLWYLGKSIQALGDSDMAIFACDWAMARGCIVERVICDIYKIPILDETDLIEYANSLQYD